MSVKICEVPFSSPPLLTAYLNLATYNHAPCWGLARFLSLSLARLRHFGLAFLENETDRFSWREYFCARSSHTYTRSAVYSAHVLLRAVHSCMQSFTLAWKKEEKDPRNKSLSLQFYSNDKNEVNTPITELG